MKKLVFFVCSFLVFFSCKQNSPQVKSILKLHNIAIDGNSLNEESLKKGDATIDYKNGSFELKLDAEIFNVKVFFSLGNKKSEITQNVVDSIPYIVNTEKDILCKISFEGDKISQEYKFNIHHLPKEQKIAPNLTSLIIGEEKIAEIKDEMSSSFSSFSERIPVSFKTDVECEVSFSPELQEGMLVCSFDKETEVEITLKGEAIKTYKLKVRVANANVTEEELRLTFLKVYGQEIKPIKDRNDFVLSYDSPYNIPLEALANNGAIVETEPPRKDGKIEVPFNKKETFVKITCKKDGFTSRTYFLNIVREQEKAELRSLKVNGHFIEINNEMNVSISYSKAKSLVEAIGKYGTNVSFNPSLDTEGKIDLAEGQTKRIEITVTKPNVLPSVYALNLTRETTPSSPRPSNVESIMISVGHNATRNFSEIDKDFPSTKESAKYEITRANEYTLRIEKLNEADTITVIGSDDKVIMANKTEGLVSFYNLTLKEVDSEKSSIEEIKIKIVEKNMQEKTVSCKMCFEGAWARAFKKPVAVIGKMQFEALLTKINYLSEGGMLTLLLEAYDSFSTVKQEDGSDFPASINVGEDVAEIGFVLTTVTDREVRSKVRFKKATENERTLLEYLKFYPKEPDIVNGSFVEYSKRLSPLFTNNVQQYELEVEAGDDKVFFDLAPIMKEADVKVTFGGNVVEKEEYYNNYGNKIELYAFELSPKERKTLSIEVISDLDSSISRTYTIDVISPDDDIVAKFDATFFDSDDKKLPTLPATGKDSGIRLPPQDHDGKAIKIKIEGKAEGITFLAKRALVTFNKEGKIDNVLKEEPIVLDGENSATFNTDIGMNYIVIQATARNGITKLKKIYEVYKFSTSNKVRFEFSDDKNTVTIEPSQYQMIEALPLSAPIKFKGYGGATFAVSSYSDIQLKHSIKTTANGVTECTIFEVPKLMLIGLSMPGDNARLFYIIVVK